MAIHYYDEDNIEVGKNFDCRVVVNHTLSKDCDKVCYQKESIIKKIL